MGEMGKGEKGINDVCCDSPQRPTAARREAAAVDRRDRREGSIFTTKGMKGSNGARFVGLRSFFVVFVVRYSLPR